MKQKLGVLFLFISIANSVLAQLNADNSLTIEQYIQDVLLGQNVSVSNITFNGGSANVSSPAVGGFECVDCNLGIGSGFIMASGDVTGAEGPNNNTGSTLPGTGTFQGSDPDLLDLVQANGGTSVNDWVIIEFDFVPLGDTLRFNYVWGSEEYDTYVGSGFNDVFGFFLSGPGINGPYSNNAENIALVPGTNEGVAINTINNGQGNGGPCNNCQYYNQLGSDNDFFNNMDDDIYTNPYYMQYDGYTDVLTAIGLVQCGQTYHIKLAICDANDSGLDSGIFLERDSFSSNLVVQVELNFEVGGPDGNSLYENCGTGNLIFSRPESFDNDNSFVAYLSYDGSATMGIDFNELPDSIVFDPGVESVEIPIDAFTDGLNEGTENVHMIITNLAQCSEVMLESEFEFFINDEAEPLVVEGYEEHICDGATVELIPIISGGYANYGYQWSTGETTETISVSPPGDIVYNVIVTDTCGMPSDDADISIIVGFPPMSISVSPDPIEVGCDGLNLTGEVSGGDGSYTWNWLDGDGNNMWGWQNTLWLSTWNFTDEILVAVEDGCGETAEVTVYPVSTFEPMVVNIEPNIVVSCPGDYTIEPEITGGSEPYFFSWYDANWNYLGGNSSYTVNFTGTMTLNFTVSDNCGGYFSSMITLTLDPIELMVSLPQGLSGSCTDVFTIDPDVTGGGGIYAYEWTSGGDVVGQNEILQFVTTETADVILTVNDNCGNEQIASTTITIITVPPVLNLSEDQTATCVETRTFTAEALAGEPAYSFVWSVAGNQIAAGNTAEYQAFESTEITCVLTDACGLTDEETVMLTIYNPPITLGITPDSTICLGDEIELVVDVTGGAGTISYFWPTVLDDSENTLYHVNVRPGSSQEYEVIVADECGQQETAEVDVDVEFVVADFTVEYLNDSEVLLEALSADSCIDCSYYWNFGDGSTFLGDSVLHEYDGLDQYQVALYVSNSRGCNRTNYQVVYPPVQLYIPNTFTPDGDGINDVWKFEANGVVTFELKIFNRWGDVIFSSNNPNVVWTGDVHDGEYYAQDGIYSWYIEYTGVDGDARSRSGSVNVLR